MPKEDLHFVIKNIMIHQAFDAVKRSSLLELVGGGFFAFLLDIVFILAVYWCSCGYVCVTWVVVSDSLNKS